MAINKPYFRMVRQNTQKSGYLNDYVIDPRNISDWSSPLRAFNLLVQDFKKICEYIDPNDDNLSVYSHRLYELYIRSCTELESNMKAILKANDYIKKVKGKKDNDKNWNIKDYKKLESVLKLSKYKVQLIFWNGGRGIECDPFGNLKKGASNNLVWYSEYNNVKHNREEYFHKASLENVIESICGLFVVLFAQYGAQVFNPYQEIESYCVSGNGLISHNSSIFRIQPPKWDENERYDFDWDELRNEKHPFKKYFT
jgi:hypothetical protein